MAKDPAALFYIANFLVATAEMKGDCTGWYVRLILHQFEKKDLPNDIEELANLANVRASEYDSFKHVWQHVLKQKFEVLPTGRLQDLEAAEIIRAREDFKAKRAAAGRMSAFIKMIRKHLCQDENVIFFIKNNVDPQQIETTNQHVLKQVFEQMFQLYINIDIDKNKEGIEKEERGVGEEEGGREENFSGSTPPQKPDRSENGRTHDPPFVPPRQGPPWPDFASPLPGAMVDAYLAVFPDYPRQDQLDRAAAAQLAYQIAQYRGWSWEAVSNRDMKKVLDAWREIVAWIATDDWYKTKSISFLSGNFQGLIQAKNHGTKRTGNGKAPGRNFGPGAANGLDPTRIEREGVGEL